ncbi:MAG TPA: tyrosine-type recombinase/integrase [Candidatus Binatia bacterium]
MQEFDSLFGDTPLAQITTWQIEKWKSDKGKTVQRQTVNRSLTVIKHMFKKAVDWSRTKTDPASGVKRYKVVSERTRFLSAADVQTILQKCKEDLTSPWLYPLVKLALNTGMRQGELLRLKWEGINFEPRHDQRPTNQNNAVEDHRH